MNKLILLLIILQSIFVSCGTNENSKISDNDKELLDLIESITKNGDGIKPDSITANRILELIDNNSKKWKEVKSEKGNFRIEFPDFEIKEGQTTQLLDGEEIIIYYYSINTQNENHDNLGYRVDYSFSPNIKTTEQINEEFNMQRDYVLSATNSILEYENVIDTLNYLGRDMYLTIDNSKIKTRYRLFFDKGIFYKLTVRTEDGKHFNKSITRFLNSFKILDNIK